MEIEYDPAVDALYVRLNKQEITESEEVQPSVILDFDESGKVVGVEILSASKRNEHPVPKAA